MQNDNRLDGKTASEIKRRVERLLREMGVKEPPLNLEDVMDHLSVDHSYYDLEDPTLIRDFWHKLKVGASKVHSVMKRIDLKAIWLPDSRHIIVDHSVPNPKRKWVNAHEVTHSIIPTHREFFLGDTAETLDPDYHEMLEAEANSGASELIFIGKRFTLDGLDCRRQFESIQLLRKTYQNTLATTLRRFVQYTHDIPMVGVISRPWWDEGPEYGASRCRYFLPSPRFESQFSGVRPQDVVEFINSHTSKKRGGPIGSGIIPLKDDNQETHSFLCESFFNSYDVLTLITHLKKT